MRTGVAQAEQPAVTIPTFIEMMLPAPVGMDSSDDTTLIESMPASIKIIVLSGE